MSTGRPLLYLDVDGPLNPYAAKPHRRPEGYTTHRMKPEGWIAQHPGLPRSAVRPLRVWLNPDHGRALLALADRFDLVWATTWRHEANTCIAPVLGLPVLPVVDWPATLTPGPNGTFWKTRHLVTHAAGRPFVWLDDELDDRDRQFVADHHDGRALLRRVDPRVGLRAPDFDAVAEFASDL
ncbi:HAD domain-containing protein [Streptomyces sp. NPDC005402]|uniref:HAD domain-containing protein n=1 Tax=Streptomyces sp. NPDC005402 TaxID=3155338 RepID=UPI0033AA65FE